jgi:hypothetical protein
MSWDLETLRKVAGLQEAVEPVAEIIEETVVVVSPKPIKKTTVKEGWDIADALRVAGLFEGRSYDDDDDEDPDVKRAEQELKKRKVALPKVQDIDPDKDLADLAAAKEKKKAVAKAAKDAAAHAAHEKAETPAKEKAEQAASSVKDEAKETPAEEKKEEAAVAKKRGKAPQEGSKSGQLRAWIKAHPGAKRSEAWAWAQTIDPPFTKAGFSTIYQACKGKMVKECYILRHPSVPSFVLHENKAMNMYQWISESDLNQEPVVVQTIAEADKISNYLKSIKNQLSTIERVSLED